MPPKSRYAPILAALVLAPASASLAEPSSDPAGARYVYFGETNDAGALASAYVSAPDPARHTGLVDAWMVYVFKTPLATPKGAAGYSVTLQTYDCDHVTMRTLSGNLYGFGGRLLDHFDANTPFGPRLPRGSVGLLGAGIVCGDAAAGALHGLSAVIADAARLAGR